MIKSKISDVQYYSEETADVEHFTNENLGSCCSEIFIFLICFVFFGPLLIVVGVGWLISGIFQFIAYTFGLILHRNRDNHNNIGISLTFEEARWIDELNTSMIGVLFMEKPLELAELKNIIDEKIFTFDESTKKNITISQRFRQIAQRKNFTWKWIEDQDFNLNNHILPLSHCSRNLSDVLGEITNKTFNISHPLWNLFLLDSPIEITEEKIKRSKIKDNENQIPKIDQLMPNTTIILKIHPSVTDGTSLHKILTELVNDKCEPTKLRSSYQRKSIIIKISSAIFYGMYIFFKSWCKRKSRQNIFGNGMEQIDAYNSPENAKNQFLFCHFSLEEITRLKLITRSTFGEIALSLLSSGIKYHHHILSKTVNIKDCPCLITIDMSSKSHKVEDIQKIRNNLSFFSIQLPLATEGIIPILWELKQRIRSFKSSSEYVFLYLFPKLLSRILSTKLTNKLMQSYYRKSRILLSSFNNFGKPMSIKGNQTKNILFWFPIFELISISMTCFSYNDQFTICLRGKNSKFVNLQLLLNAIKYQAEHLVKLLENRRVPGEKSDITYLNNYAGYLNPNLTPDNLTEDQILNLLNDIQIKIQNQSNHTAKEIEEMKLSFSILFSTLKSKKKTTENFIEFDEDLEEAKYSISRRLSLPSKSKVIQKQFMKRLSASTHDLNMKQIEGKIPEDQETDD